MADDPVAAWIARWLGAWPGLLLAALAGAVLPLAFAPMDHAALAVLSPAVLFAVAASAPPRRALQAGFLFGLGCFGVGVSWVFVSIDQFGGGPVAAAVVTAGFVVVLSVFPALTAAGGRLLPVGAWGRQGWTVLFLLPALWVLLEWVRSWLFTGFPWLLLGYAALDTPLASIAPVGGVYALSLVLAVTGGTLAWLLLRPGWRRALVVVGWLGVLGAGLAATDREWTEPTGATVEAALVQGNIPQDIKWHPDYQEAIRERYVELTTDVLGADLVVWPETAIPQLYHRVAEDFVEPIGDVVRAMGGTLILGVPYRDAARESMHNSIVAVNPQRSVYHKRHLVPYGEYVPFRDWFGRSLDFLGAPMADYEPGPTAHPLETPVGPLGATICYEVAYPRAVASTAGESVALLNVSNDAWFGDSLAPHQHFQKARMRSLENGRDMIRSTNTGISAVIDARGRVRERLPSFEPGAAIVEVRPRHGVTPYTRYGELPTLLFVGAVLLWSLVWALWWRRTAW